MAGKITPEHVRQKQLAEMNPDDLDFAKRVAREELYQGQKTS
ncbi:MAG: hypothetical protein WCJ19_00790 [bacterium]